MLGYVLIQCCLLFRRSPSSMYVKMIPDMVPAKCLLFNSRHILGDRHALRVSERQQNMEQEEDSSEGFICTQIILID